MTTTSSILIWQFNVTFSYPNVAVICDVYFHHYFWVWVGPDDLWHLFSSLVLGLSWASGSMAMFCDVFFWLVTERIMLRWWKFLRHRKNNFVMFFERFVIGTQTWRGFYNKMKFVINLSQINLCEEFGLYNDENHSSSKQLFPPVLQASSFSRR